MKRIFATILFVTAILFSIKSSAQEPFLEKIIPRNFAVQYAGGIGMISAGIEYPFLQDKLNLGLLYGYVPKSKGGTLNILSAKIRYSPFEIPINENLALRPVNPVFILSNTFGPDFHLFWPKEQYGKGYYWWSSALRWHFGLSSEIRVHSFNESIFNECSFFLEANAADMYIYAVFANPDYLSLTDILYVGFGVRFGIRALSSGNISPEEEY